MTDHRPTPRTGNGYSENKDVQKDILLDARLKKFQADFVKEQPKTSLRDIFRKGKK